MTSRAHLLVLLIVVTTVASLAGGVAIIANTPQALLPALPQYQATLPSHVAALPSTAQPTPVTIGPTSVAMMPTPAPALPTVAPVQPTSMISEEAPRVNVAIQAGHWKSAELPDALAQLRGSTGAAGGGRTEPQVTLDIAERTARLLRDKGLTVEVLPATVPTGYNADLFIALHADGSSTSRPRGYKVSTRWRSEVAAMDALLVQSIEQGYGTVTKLPQDSNITRAMRGYYAYSSYRGEEYRIGDTTPAAILEMGFMTNAQDRALMFNNPDLIARGVVAGIENFYARRAEGLQAQAQAEQRAAASAFGRSVVVLAPSTSLRADGSADAARLGSAGFADSFPLQQASGPRPQGGTFDPRQGTQSVTGVGWYKISIPETSQEAYISRDVVVVQQ
jgi:hypothetical protein